MKEEIGKCGRNEPKSAYVAPAMKKHEPLKILQGSESDTDSYGGSLYTVVLYYYY